MKFINEHFEKLFEQKLEDVFYKDFYFENKNNPNLLYIFSNAYEVLIVQIDNKNEILKSLKSFKDLKLENVGININKEIIYLSDSYFRTYKRILTINYNVKNEMFDVYRQQLLYDFHFDKMFIYNSNGKRIPLSLKHIVDISHINYCFAEYMLKKLSKEYIIFKDLYKDFLNNKYSINTNHLITEITACKTKKDIFKSKNKKYTNSTNKISILNQELLNKAEKKILDNQIEILKTFIPKTVIKNRYESEKIHKLFTEYYCHKFKANDDLKNRICDYVNIKLKAKSKFNLKIGKRKLLDEELILSLVKRKDKMIIKKDNPFKILVLPETFTPIDTSDKLYNEAVSQKNCVYSYLPYVNSQNMFIYSLDYNDKKYTVAVTYFEEYTNKFRLHEIKGFANEPAENEVIDYVKKCLKNKAC